MPEKLSQVIAVASLRKLIVVDSFAASRIREVRLDGHVHVAGRNGRGKTTLIRLIPLFYGEQPRHIVKAAGNVVRTLQEFMFSRSTSYVAFEYENGDGIKLAILHFGSDGAQYHLADGEYSRDLFVEKDAFIEGRHLNARLRTLGRRPSSALGVLQYRAVIQGTAGRLGMADLRPLVQRFALAPGKSRLKGIERISSGMFSKDITFSALKAMAASVAFDEENREIALKLSAKEIGEFLPDFKAYKAVMAQESAYLAANSANLQAQFELRRRNAAAARLRCLVLALGRYHDAVRARVTDEEDKLAAMNMAARQTATEFEQKIRTLEGNARQLREEVSAIDREEADWEKQKAGELSLLVDRLPALEQEERRLQELRRTLLAKADSVAQKYQALYSEEKARRTQMRADAQGRSNGIISALSSESDAVRGRFDEERKQLGTQQEVEDAVCNEQLEEAEDGVRECERQLADLLPAVELQSAVEQAEAAVQSANGRLTEANQLTASARLEQAHAQNAIGLRETEATQAAQKQARTREHLEHLLSLENAGTGTLLHHLRQKLPHWHEDIAKVVREDLLLRTDLAPAPADGESLYGLALDLRKIEAGRASNEAALTLDIQAARAAASDTDNALVESNRLTVAARASLDECRQKLASCLEAGAQAKDHATDAQEAFTAARRLMHDELEDRRRTVQARRTEAQALLNVRKAALLQLRQTHKGAAGRLAAEFDRASAAIRQRKEAEVLRVGQELQQLEREQQKARLGLDRVRDAELSKAGIDTKALKPLEAQLTDAQQQVETARNGVHVVEQYRRWLTSRPMRRLQCQREIEALVAETALRMREFDEAKTRDASQIVTQAGLVEKQRQEQQAVYVRLQNAETAERSRLVQNDAGAAAEPDAVALSWLLGEILDSFDQARQRALEQEGLTAKHLGAVIKVFRKHEFSATRVGEYAAHFDANYLTGVAGTVSLLHAWYTTAHLQQRDVLAGKIRSGCGMLQQFQAGMIDFQSRINGLSRELQDSLMADLVFDAIRSLKLRLSATVERRPYWDALTQVLTEYRKWQADAYAGLPAQQLLDALQEFSRHLPESGLAENPNTLMDLEIDVDDGNENKRVRTEADLRQVSSNGLSYLILCLIFVAFANRARRDSDLWLTWALDEIGTIDDGNSRALLQMLDRNRIRLVSASPDAKESLQMLFNHRYEILPEFEIRRVLNEDELPALQHAGAGNASRPEAVA